MYAKCFKRIFDFVLSLVALFVLSPILLLLAIIGAVAMKGNPFFTQLRPGKIGKRTGEETIFRLIKFRTMTCEKDADGNLLPDDKRLTRYGRFLRSTSLDELPELINILKGDMSIVGPRPLLVRDMVFMGQEQRRRHLVRPGLSGLAQIKGRNGISWETKLSFDIEYLSKISFLQDIKIIFLTVIVVLKRKGITQENFDTAEDYGDYLLRNESINEIAYQEKMMQAEKILALASQR